MAITNHERVGKAMELLRAGLGIQTIRNYAEDPNLARKSVGEWDVAALLKLMWEAWNDVFRRTLGPSERGLVGELRGHRGITAEAALRLAKFFRTDAQSRMNLQDQYELAIAEHEAPAAIKAIRPILAA